VTAVRLAEKLDLKVFCVGGVYLHHAGRSGYGLLEQYLGERWGPHPLVKWLGDGVLRIPARMLCSHCGLFEYSRENLVAELALIPRYLSTSNCVWHFLYAEKQYLLTAFAPRGYRRWCVGTFHHHPAKFSYMVQRTAHYRTLALAIAVSTVQIEFLEKIVGKDRVVFVPHGIDTDYWTPGPSVEYPPRNVLVFAGCHMRDFATLGRVIDDVLRWRKDLEFVLISPERECGQIYRKHNVRWLYRIPDNEYLRWMQQAALLVLPLKFSTAVNTVLEALACGTPVVTTEGGISDYLDDSCSVQLKRGDAQGMARAILELVDSPETLTQMRSAARQKALEFSWPKVAARIRKIFAERFA
jgi:glycosyltransferase involved in cell wall biosynthesis